MIALDRAVLLPIDMQQGFDAPSLPRRWNEAVDANGLALLAAWRTGRQSWPAKATWSIRPVALP